jgi:gamma-carbonic anhydrase
LTSCIIQDQTCIGMNSVVQEGSVIESKVIVGPGSVISSGTLVPSGQYWSGVPARFVRNLSEDEQLNIEKTAEKISSLATEHSDEFLPYGTMYQEAELKEQI